LYPNSWDWIDPVFGGRREKKPMIWQISQRPVNIQGYDIDENAVKMARQYAFNALDSSRAPF
jgi:hypothetical protein